MKKASSVKTADSGLLHLSLLLLGVSLVGSFIRWGDILMLGVFADASQTGLYQFAKRIASVIGLLIASVVGVFAPFASEFEALNRSDQAGRYLKLVSRWCFSVAWLSALFLLLYGRSVLGLLNEDFLPAADELALLAISQVLWALTAANGMLLTMTGRAGLNLATMALAMLVNLSLNLYLIPRSGAMGAAIAMLVTVGLYGVLQTYCVWRFYRLSPLSKALFKPLVAGLASGVAGLALKNLAVQWSPILHLPMAGLLLVASFVGVSHVLGLESEDREVLRTLFRGVRL